MALSKFNTSDELAAHLVSLPFITWDDMNMFDSLTDFDMQCVAFMHVAKMLTIEEQSEYDSDRLSSALIGFLDVPWVKEFLSVKLFVIPQLHEASMDVRDFIAGWMVIDPDVDRFVRGSLDDETIAFGQFMVHVSSQLQAWHVFITSSMLWHPKSFERVKPDGLTLQRMCDWFGESEIQWLASFGVHEDFTTVCMIVCDLPFLFEVVLDQWPERISFMELIADAVRSPYAVMIPEIFEALPDPSLLRTSPYFNNFLKLFAICPKSTVQLLDDVISLTCDELQLIHDPYSTSETQRFIRDLLNSSTRS